MTKDIFLKEIERLLKVARQENKGYVDIVSGAVHKNIGVYPQRKHNMRGCCNVMRSLMQEGDEILEAPPKGDGATLKIRYFI